MEMDDAKKRRLDNYAYLFVAVVIMGAGFALVFTAPNKITGMATTASQVGNLSVSVATYVACTWTDDSLTVSFGTNLDPSTVVNATKNYNITTNNGTNYFVNNSMLSNVQVNISIRGTDLTSGANVLGVGNITWKSNITISNSTQMIPANDIDLTAAYDTANHIASFLPRGSAAYFRLWLAVPASQTAGSYNGTYTQLCEQA